MLSDEERRAKEAARLKDPRVLIVMNLLNGVPEWKVAETFHMDVADVKATFKRAMAKVSNYLFRLCKPPIFCETIADAQRNRINIMAILPKLNPDVDPMFGRIVNETVTSANYESAIHDLRR